jgi:hypothetical protein
MKTTDHFKNTIQEALNMRAFSDKLFAQTLAKENKSIEECCNYILTEVKKSGCNGFEDSEIIGMAIHYYDEDDIKDVKSVSRKNVVVNHTIVLTAEEKVQARKKAMDQLVKEEREKLVKKAPKPKTTYNSSGKKVEVKQEVKQEPGTLF